jgi:hypothetical protein
MGDQAEAEAASEQSADAGEAEQGEAAGDEDVVEADYEIVDESEEK